MDISIAKKLIRWEIKLKKKEHTEIWLKKASSEIFENIENMDIFRESDTILIYYSLPDEVSTIDFINKWYEKKNIVLPVVNGDTLILKKYIKEKMKTGAFNIPEPFETEIIEAKYIELALSPGVAFDKKCDRLGRGKGFYDRILNHLTCTKIGIGFSFQIIDNVPVEDHDKPLDFIVTENEIINN